MKNLAFEPLYKKSIDLDKYFTHDTQLSSICRITIQTVLNNEVNPMGVIPNPLSIPAFFKEIRCHIDEITKYDIKYFSGGMVPEGSLKIAINPLDARWFKLESPQVDRYTTINIQIKQRINNELKYIDGVYKPVTHPMPNTNGSGFVVLLTRQGES